VKVVDVMSAPRITVGSDTPFAEIVDRSRPTASGRHALANRLRTPEIRDASASVAAGVIRLERTVQWASDCLVVEVVVAGIRGVIGVENLLEARGPEPRPDGPWLAPCGNDRPTRRRAPAASAPREARAGQHDGSVGTFDAGAAAR